MCARCLIVVKFASTAGAASWNGRAVSVQLPTLVSPTGHGQPTRGGLELDGDAFGGICIDARTGSIIGSGSIAPDYRHRQRTVNAGEVVRLLAGSLEVTAWPRSLSRSGRMIWSGRAAG